jgi:hypothetical protein
MAAAAVASGNEAPVDDILITDGQGGVLATISLADMIPRKLRR